MPDDVKGLVCHDENEAITGLVTWITDGDFSEIVTLDALVRGKGHGSRLLSAAEAKIAEAGARTVRVLTTNDNVKALGFYLKRGYRLKRIHHDAMERVRERKPGIPLIGEHNIPLTDMLELTKRLTK